MQLDTRNDLFADFPVRVVVRGYVEGVLQFEDHVELDPTGIDALATKHAEACGNGLFMIEIEFLDEPDPLQRFHRFGTDTRRMVMPVLWSNTDYPD